MKNLEQFEAHFTRTPIIAILRGVSPDEAVAIGTALVDAGISLIEVPLNSPDPFVSISRLATSLSGKAVIGAGTVLSPEDVEKVRTAGGTMIISPNTDVEVIKASVTSGLVSLPGCFTPTEAFAALHAGAHGLKIFPGEAASQKTVKALNAVLPKGTRLLLVGGVDADNIRDWKGTPISGFGIGSGLYKARDTVATVARKADRFMAAIK
ncbi:2-dehydro-3-deoxy-6-phosphogalactonate aldolase [uncultured Cohaesibacter sp.]|uniref:2-dehydro-3-deoxy-6-phosphogalactonate aldolase n=1 Tax=uncultured Cohaesibacter sp. TaxID=1002546 RepID=UPI002931A8C6|nr:2-dehydro-3-deoxy-6-phosphogalactonate aldolase [uncultured Cohaesibacter sp.]